MTDSADPTTWVLLLRGINVNPSTRVAMADLREAFKKRLAYSVMLDWDGSVVKQFAYEKNVANIYVIDRGGRIVKRLSGAVSNEALRTLFRAIEAAIADAQQNDPV